MFDGNNYGDSTINTGNNTFLNNELEEEKE